MVWRSGLDPDLFGVVLMFGDTLILVFVSSPLAFMLACCLSLVPSQPRVSLPGAHPSKGSSLPPQHVGVWAGRGCL